MYISAWQQYTPYGATHSGLADLLKKLGVSAANDLFTADGTYRRIGSVIEVAITYQTRTPPSNLSPTIALPPGFTVDFSKLPPGTPWYNWSNNSMHTVMIHGQIPIH